MLGLGGYMKVPPRAQERDLHLAMSSLASGRSARSLAPSAKSQALAKLAQLKQGGLKRTDQFEVR